MQVLVLHAFFCLRNTRNECNPVLALRLLHVLHHLYALRCLHCVRLNGNWALGMCSTYTTLFPDLLILNLPRCCLCKDIWVTEFE